jgi:hypothetical protein
MMSQSLPGLRRAGIVVVREMRTRFVIFPIHLI